MSHSNNELQDYQQSQEHPLSHQQYQEDWLSQQFAANPPLGYTSGEHWGFAGSNPGMNEWDEVTMDGLSHQASGPARPACDTHLNSYFEDNLLNNRTQVSSFNRSLLPDIMEFSTFIADPSCQRQSEATQDHSYSSHAAHGTGTFGPELHDDPMAGNLPATQPEKPGVNEPHVPDNACLSEDVDTEWTRGRFNTMYQYIAELYGEHRSCWPVNSVAYMNQDDRNLLFSVDRDVEKWEEVIDEPRLS